MVWHCETVFLLQILSLWNWTLIRNSPATCPAQIHWDSSNWYCHWASVTVSDVQPSDALSTSEKSGQALPLSFYLVPRLLLNHVFCINSVLIVFILRTSWRAKKESFWMVTIFLDVLVVLMMVEGGRERESDWKDIAWVELPVTALTRKQRQGDEEELCLKPFVCKYAFWSTNYVLVCSRCFIIHNY